MVCWIELKVSEMKKLKVVQLDSLDDEVFLTWRFLARKVLVNAVELVRKNYCSTLILNQVKEQTHRNLSLWL